VQDSGAAPNRARQVEEAQGTHRHVNHKKTGQADHVFLTDLFKIELQFVIPYAHAQNGFYRYHFANAGRPVRESPIKTHVFITD